MHLKNLLSMKALKLEHSEQNVRGQELSMRAAHHAHTSGVKQHEQYRLWRIEEETRLFNLCKNQLLDRKRLEQWKQSIALLREKEAYLEETIAQKTQILTEEREKLSLCRQRLVEAQRQFEKFSQLNQQVLTEERLIIELKEEEELDEFRRSEVSFE